MTHAILDPMEGAPITAELDAKREALTALCRRFGVARLELFGSAARGTDFAPASSDLDFLVTLTPAARDDLAGFAELP